jgi:hypothetical protein
MLYLCCGHHLHFLLWCQYRQLLWLVHGSMMTPADTAPSNCAPSPLAPNLPHATNRGEHSWRPWSGRIMAELLLLNADTVLQALNLLKFLVCLLLYRLRLYRVAINDCCNCVALRRIR